MLQYGVLVVVPACATSVSYIDSGVNILIGVNKVIVVPDSKTPDGRRCVPMSNRVEKILRDRSGNRRLGWVFPAKRARSGHLTTVAKRFREAPAKAGLPDSLVLYCGCHDYGTRVLRETGNLAVVMKTMGHKDARTAMRYQHPKLDIVRYALNQSSEAAMATAQ
ncbi:MAG TPA: tyrosine-type recombinase/integrase [Candidatus Angelobacter sp.]|nr:tyrosine-type recombinase/integrase [Candidatus Angelobacter sp.]